MAERDIMNIYDVGVGVYPVLNAERPPLKNWLELQKKLCGISYILHWDSENSQTIVTVSKDGASKTAYFKNGVNTCEIKNGITYVNAFVLQKTFFDFVALFQVTEITSNSITIETKNMKGKFITLREVDWAWSSVSDSMTKDTGRIVHFSDDFNYEGIYSIKDLKSTTRYNIVVGDPNLKNSYAVLNYPILTFYNFDTAITKQEYDTTYREQLEKAKNNQIPISWSVTNETRAKVSEFSLNSTFYIRGGVEDTDVYNKGFDGINDINEYTEDRFFKSIKRFYFPNLGITVFECPFKPGYFNVNWNMALLGNTQCYVEIDKKKICYTLKDLDDLDYAHRFDLVFEATWTSFRIALSGVSDVLTVFAWGPVTGAKAFLTSFLKGLKPEDIPLLNVIVGIVDSVAIGIVKHGNPLENYNELSEWGNWLFEFAIPFVGTYRLIEATTDIEPTITEAKDSPPPRYGDIIGSSAQVDGIFFRSN